MSKFYVQRGSRVKRASCWPRWKTATWPPRRMDNQGAYMAAQAAYATATGAQVPEDTQKAELDVKQAKANLDLNQSIVKGRKQLFAEGAFPDATWTRQRRAGAGAGRL